MDFDTSEETINTITFIKYVQTIKDSKESLSKMRGFGKKIDRSDYSKFESYMGLIDNVLKLGLIEKYKDRPNYIRLEEKFDWLKYTDEKGVSKICETVGDLSKCCIQYAELAENTLNQKEIKIEIEKPKSINKSIDSAVVWGVRTALGTMSIMCFNSACGKIGNGLLGMGISVLLLLMCNYKELFFSNN